MVNDHKVASLDRSFSIGKRLMAFRKNAGLSQRELARRAKMTNSTLSTIEQDKVSPSVASLEKILSAIPMSLNAFFSQSQPQSAITKNAKMLCVQGEGYVVQSLPLSFFQESLSYFKIDMAAKATTNRCTNDNNTLNAGVLTKGTIALVINGQINILEEGDGFEFNHACEFFFENSSRQPAELTFLGDSSVFEHISQASLI